MYAAIDEDQHAHDGQNANLKNRQLSCVNQARDNNERRKGRDRWAAGALALTSGTDRNDRPPDRTGGLELQFDAGHRSAENGKHEKWPDQNREVDRNAGDFVCAPSVDELCHMPSEMIAKMHTPRR